MGHMQSATAPGTAPSAKSAPFLAAFVCLFVILAVLFHRSFEHNMVAFSNDGPLGAINGEQFSLPEAFTGMWLSAYWIGGAGGQLPVDPTFLMLWWLGPIGASKFYVPLSLFILGLCAWTFFRVLGLGRGLSIIAAIAAALNGNFFSNACWGLGSRPLSLAALFLALAAIGTKKRGNPWLNAALAGLAIGMSVTEGVDNGVIFSIYFAAYVVVQSFAEGGPFANGFRKSLRLVLVTGLAMFFAASTVQNMMGYVRKGGGESTKAPEQFAAEQQANWQFATQWSLPPKETLRVIVPGLFGYRMDSPDGAMYWGRVGEGVGLRRFNGSGEYAGLLVVLLALWAVASSCSSTQNMFAPSERKLIWFWAGVALVSVLLAWGHFAPFYRLVYALPYFSSIRNPMKFMHPCHMALMILFGYGLLGMSRRYFEKAVRPLSWGAQLKSWWSKASGFDRKWVLALAVMIVASAAATMAYASAIPNLEKHLVANLDPGLASAVAKYSATELGLYLVWLALTAAAIVLVMSGLLSGARARWGIVLFGLLLTADLARANLPWIVHWNYPYKYEANPVMSILRERPFEGRVTRPQFPPDDQLLKSAGGLNPEFPKIYGIEWNQHHFPYFNIQCMDDIQDPRPPADKMAYLSVLRPPNSSMRGIGRYWQLTNTRYILSLAAYQAQLNEHVAGTNDHFRVAATFSVAPKGPPPISTYADLTVQSNPSGPLALFEYTGALPRVKLFSNWEVSTNDTATLQRLADLSFDPLAAVIVSDPIAPPSPAATDSSSAQIVGYKPKRVEIKAHAGGPSILLLNDHYHSDWHVTVDGQPAPMLRCNYIMRGVQLAAGDHTVLFSYKSPMGGLKVTLTAYAVSVVLLGIFLFVKPAVPPEPAPTPTPANKPANRPAEKAK